MKKIFIGIIFSIILVLCFCNVQAESVQPESAQVKGVQAESLQVENESVTEVQNGTKEKLARSAEGITKQVTLRGNNKNSDYFSVALVLGEHETEKLSVFDQNGNNYTEHVTLSIEDPSIATIDGTGIIKAKKEGTTNIIATGKSIEETKWELRVYNKENITEFTDFSNAKFEYINNDIDGQRIRITGIKSNHDSNYFAIIGKSPTAPEIKRDEYGRLDEPKMGLNSKYSLCLGYGEDGLQAIVEDNMESTEGEEYYLYIVEQKRVDQDREYYDEDGNNVSFYCKYVVEAHKLNVKPENTGKIVNSDSTVAPGKTLPKTGIGTAIIVTISIIAVSAVGVVTYNKYDKYKQLSKFVK